MCYKAYTNQCAKKRIAKKDLIVFKVGRLNSNNFVPYYHEFYRYKIGVKQPKVELLYNPESRSIDRGYHSYKYAEFKRWEPALLPSAVDVLIDLYASPAIFNCLKTKPVIIGKFIIPKGSAYYKNRCNEIVSEQIKFTGIIYVPNFFSFGELYRDKINLNKLTCALTF